MDEVTIWRTEAMIDFGAAAVLGAAVAWLCMLGFEPPASAAAGSVGLAATFAALRQVRPGAISFRLAEFEPCELDPAELLLTGAAIHHGPATHELVLDDALAPADPESRVVRLFDVSAMPSPGELKARIDRHLDGPPSAPPDASQALFDALAELRSSLR